MKNGHSASAPRRQRRFVGSIESCGLTAAVWTATCASASAQVPETPLQSSLSLLALLLTGAMALVGAVLLAVGLLRLADGSEDKTKGGLLGAFGRFGRRGGEESMRMKGPAGAILAGVLLLGLPDLLGVGFFTQITTAYYNANPPPPPTVLTGRGLRIDELATARPKRVDPTGVGQGSGLPIPWWLVVGVLVFVAGALLLRRSAGGSSISLPSLPSLSAASGPTAVTVVPPKPSSLPAVGGAAGGGSAAPGGLLAYLFDLLERIQRRIDILLKGLQTEIRHLQDKTEDRKGRWRPLIAFALNQLAALIAALRDKDDGGSGLPPAETYVHADRLVAERHAKQFAERVARTLELGAAGEPFVALARHLKIPERRLRAGLLRFGAVGAPTPWVRAVSSDGEVWMLDEGAMRSADCRFSGAVRFGELDWTRTLADGADRDANDGLVLTPCENVEMRLVAADDPRAVALAARLNDSDPLPADMRWCFVDIPRGFVRRHYGPESDGKWQIAPDAYATSDLVVIAGEGFVQILAGADHLDEALADGKGPIRALAGVLPKGALAALGLTAADVVPEDVAASG